MRLGPTTLKILTQLARKPSTSREVREALRPEGCTQSWGNSYFLPANSKANGYHSSLRRRGLIEARGREGCATIWAITHTGFMELYKHPGLASRLPTSEPVQPTPHECITRK